VSNGAYKYDPPRPPLDDPVEELQLPNYNVGSLNTWPQTRIAYLHGELAMQRVNATLIRAGVNAEQRARRMFDLRNALRSWTRDLMHNRTDAEGLTLHEQNPSFAALFAKKKAKALTDDGKVLTDDEAYEAMIKSSTESRPVANGPLDPKNPPPLSPVWPSFPIWGQPVLYPSTKASRPPSPPPSSPASPPPSSPASPAPPPPKPPIVGDSGF
jgi:hypothetical protein